MTTLSKEDVVRMAEQLGLKTVGDVWNMMRDGDDLWYSVIRLHEFATLARADLVAENERLLAANLDCIDHFNAAMEDLTATRTALAAAEARESATRAILDQVMDDIRSEAFLFDGGNGISADTEDAADNLLDQPRDDSALREMIAAERERICSEIKSEDDRCVTEVGYMLDSNDCIAIVRGEWKRPEFGALAEKAKGE